MSKILSQGRPLWMANSDTPDGKDHLMPDGEKLKSARAGTIFCFVPISAFIITFSLQSLDSYRPHGTTAFALFSFGVVAPATLFFMNKNLRSFARKQLAWNVPKFSIVKRRPMVHPVV